VGGNFTEIALKKNAWTDAFAGALREAVPRLGHGARPWLHAASYGLSVTAGSGVGALLPAIQSSLGATIAEAARLGGNTALGAAAGKLLFAGFVVDFCGATSAMVIAMACMAVSSVAISQATDFSVVAAGAVSSDFFLTAAWPAHVQLVQASSSTVGEASRGLWKLGIGSRMGAVLAQLLYGAGEGWVGWRRAELASAVVALLTAALAVCSLLRSPRTAARTSRTSASSGAGMLDGVALSDAPQLLAPDASLDANRAPAASTPQEAPPPVPLAPLPMVRLMACSPDFWLATAGSGFVGAVKFGAQVLLGVYLRDGAAAGLIGNGLAIQLAAAFNAGVGASVIVAGHRFSAMGPAAKLWLVRSLNLVSVLAFALLAFDARLVASSTRHVLLRAGLFFVGGLGIGVSFYIPPGLFSIQFGRANAVRPPPRRRNSTERARPCCCPAAPREPWRRTRRTRTHLASPLPHEPRPPHTQGTVSAFIDGLGYGIAWLSSVLTALIVTLGNGWAGTWLYFAALYAAGAICTELYLGRMLRTEPEEEAALLAVE